MNALRLVFLLPILATAVVVIAALYEAGREIGAAPERPPFRVLIIRTVVFGVAGGVLSLLATIVWMIWYQHTTGYNAGNGPLGWIFIYGPVSVAVGELVALVTWWRQRPTAA